MGSGPRCCCGGLYGICLPNLLHRKERSRGKGLRSHLGIGRLETSRTEGNTLTDCSNPLRLKKYLQLF